MQQSKPAAKSDDIDALIDSVHVDDIDKLIDSVAEPSPVVLAPQDYPPPFSDTVMGVDNVEPSQYANAAKLAGSGALETVGSALQAPTRWGIAIAEALAGKQNTPDQRRAIGQITNPDWAASETSRALAKAIREHVPESQREDFLLGKLPEFVGAGIPFLALAPAGGLAMAGAGGLVMGSGGIESAQEGGAGPIPTLAAGALTGAAGTALGLIPGGGLGKKVAVGAGGGALSSLASQAANKLFVDPNAEISGSMVAEQSLLWLLGGVGFHLAESVAANPEYGKALEKAGVPVPEQAKPQEIPPVQEPVQPSGQPAEPRAPIEEPPAAATPETQPPEPKGAAAGEPVPETKTEEWQPAPDQQDVVGLRRASLDQEIQSLGIEPAKGGAKRPWEPMVEAANANPEAGVSLMDELRQHPRQVSDQEFIQLGLRVRDLKNQYAEASKVVVADNTPENRTRRDAAEARLTEAQSVVAPLRTQAGQALSSIAAVFKPDMSLGTWLVERAADKGRKLEDPEVAHLAALHKRIDDALNILKEVQDKVEAAGTKPPRGEFRQRLYDARVESLAWWQKNITHTAGADVFANPEAIYHAARIGASHIADFAADLAGWSKKMIEDLGEGVRPHLNDIYAKSKEMYEQGVGEPLLSTPQVRAALREKARAEKQYQEERLQDQRKQEGFFDKTKTYLRAAAFSGIGTLEHITGSGVAQTVFRPAYEAVGAFLSKLPILSDIGEKADIQGGGSVKALAHSMTQTAWSIGHEMYGALKTGTSELHDLYDPKARRPPEGVEYVMALHGALQTPLLRGEWTYAMDKINEAGIRAGAPVETQEWRDMAGARAYSHALETLFRGKTWLSKIERSLTDWGKNAGTAEKVFKTAATAEMPAIEMPTNWLRIALEHAYGTGEGTRQAIKAYRAGIENLTPDQANYTYRLLKRGLVGNALMAIAWFGYQNIGGLYERDKKERGPVEPGAAKVFGQTISRHWLRSAPILMMHAVASFRRIAEREGAVSAFGKTLFGVAENAPLARAVEDAASLARGEKSVGELAVQHAVPQLVKDVAKDTDWAEKRKTKGALDALKATIPGLREQLPPRR